MVEMELLGVRLELPSRVPIVVLRETSGDGRVLPIFIGNAEATAIALALEGRETPRPMTHDLFASVLGELGAGLDKVVVTNLVEKTFYAELHFETPTGTKVVSSRPSDAIALAVRVGAAIHASAEVLDAAGYVETDDDEEPVVEEQVVEEFREFIDTVRPEDFEA